MAVLVLRGFPGLHGDDAGEAMKDWGKLFFLVLAVSILASARMHLDGGPFLPYRFNRAVASDEDGLFGKVELTGRRWDGSRVPLFRTRLTARSRTVDLTFYLDEDIRSLELQSEGDPKTLLLDLADQDGEGAGATRAEIDLRNRMRRLDPPSRPMPDGTPSERLFLAGTDIVMAGYQASSAFGLAPPRMPLLLLTGFAFAALVIAASSALWKTAARTGAIMLSLGMTLVISKVAIPRPVLFTAAFSEVGPGARISGPLQRQVEKRLDYTRISYSADPEEGHRTPGSGTVELVGIWVPSGPGIPLAEVVPPGALVRFSSAPMLNGEGERLVSKEFITGWVVHVPY
jgi:hypothetical protein